MKKPQGLNAWTLFTGALQVAFFLAYPFVVYYGNARRAGLGLLVLCCALVLMRLRGASADLRHLLLQYAAVPVFIGVAVALDSRTLMKILPALVSLYLLGTFAWSLRSGPPMIERFARVIEDDLPPFTHPYCRKVTWVWCVFFAANALIVTALASAAPPSWWTFYTGFLFYVLLGLLGGTEFFFRKWWFRYFNDGPVDRLLAALFPPEGTANGRRSLAYVEQRRALAAEIASR